MEAQISQKPEPIDWTQELSMGVRKIDDQHKKLVSLANDLITHNPGDEASEKEYLKKILKELVDYVKIHFSTEEELMAKTKFKGLDEHKIQHETFVLKVTGKVRDFTEGQPFDRENFTVFLKNWITNHIAKTDKLYSVYFKEIATRKSDGRLTVTETDVAKM
ncbi:bacteriohemerythrin [Breznakiella homolactica]|uniref:Hemerythrin family protein n=1 Tax=Breznakiella homolactica TaxID=2798577 RepID=A0A7T7XMQ6_9SPIR|nr:bacteriohemerythrin [Breznakiella homolactica]QQO09204.1 bacteriohemerythrin [Breznakiella homolactica]